ncbi:MAG: transcription elongation factor GreA [Candidatus Vogelbacteria bacterium]|nr:transcription elongation factor GreA [Candidatus Vogelbacteria bacterium]
MDSKDYLSQEKYQELLNELNELKTTRRREVAERLDFAKSLGDLSENAEYHAAREEQSEIEDRIVQVENLLKNSKIVMQHHSLEVEVGSMLKVRKAGGGDAKYIIVGSEEADLATGKISYQSPLGSSLLGRKKGEIVAVQTPRGEMKYLIVSIE